MATEAEIRNGMTFEELLSSGNDSDSTYGALLTDLIDQIELATSPGVDSEINTLVEQMLNAEGSDEQQLIANALCDKLNQFMKTIDVAIDDDLTNQKTTREQLSNLNIAASLLPPETIKNSKLFDAIATDSFKQIIADNVIEKA